MTMPIYSLTGKKSTVSLGAPSTELLDTAPFKAAIDFTKATVDKKVASLPVKKSQYQWTKEFYADHPNIYKNQKDITNINGEHVLIHTHDAFPKMRAAEVLNKYGTRHKSTTYFENGRNLTYFDYGENKSKIFFEDKDKAISCFDIEANTFTELPKGSLSVAADTIAAE